MNTLRWFTFPSLMVATLIQAAAPVLLQGTADPDANSKAWYNSRDPEVLTSQIRLLEQTIQDQRERIRHLESQSGTEKTQGPKRKTVKPLLQRVSAPSPEIEDLSAELTKARRRIIDLESKLATLRYATANQTPRATPESVTTAEDAAQTRQLKALVRTYEKTIASLEDEMQGYRKELEAYHSAEKKIKPPPAQPEPQTDPSGPVPIETLLAPTTASALSNKTMETLAPAAAETRPALPTGKETDEANQITLLFDADPSENALQSTAERVDRGFTLILKGKNDEAEDLFLQVNKGDPEYPRAQLGLATLNYSRDELAAAKIKISAVLEKVPDNPQALGLSGIISWREGRISEAAELLGRAILLDDQDAQLYNYQAIVLHTRGDYRSAEKSLERAIALDPNHTEAHFNLAVLNTIGPMANRTKAQEYYEKAVLLGSQRDPKFEASLYPR
jgi:Flp pilus assembly protein TadD/predicted  nucleic acid-binding Zn-ribbon protein